MNYAEALCELMEEFDKYKDGMVITLYADKHAQNVFAYLEDKYDQTPTQLINRAMKEYYAEDIKELEVKKDE